MEQKTIRLLRADEIECRIGMISEKGLSLLLYKDARADMKILDEVYGSMGWQRRHELIGGNLYCIVSVWDEGKQQWISKMDVGTESYTEKEKGQASDSFKRACVSLGIGRELYTAPFIWVSAAKVKIENRNGKPMTYDKFKVSDISYNESREIVGLTILNQDGKMVYSLHEKVSAMKTTGESAAPDSRTKERNQTSDKKAAANKEQEINRELERTGVALDTVLSRYGVGSIQDMEEDTYRKAINSLKRTKTKAA
ncbi:MAG: hypothetical protein LUG99_21390 [Lachnospiraceae bacterium]|nr:hypothetical protein [Lachnospiraceae bacterium]